MARLLLSHWKRRIAMVGPGCGLKIPGDRTPALAVKWGIRMPIQAWGTDTWNRPAPARPAGAPRRSASPPLSSRAPHGNLLADDRLRGALAKQRVCVMRQLISVVTLGVIDLARSPRFYVDGFGWSPVFENEEIIFYQMNGLML